VEQNTVLPIILQSVRTAHATVILKDAVMGQQKVVAVVETLLLQVAVHQVVPQEVRHLVVIQVELGAEVVTVDLAVLVPVPRYLSFPPQYLQERT